MAKPRTDLRALRNVISEADLILAITTLPEGRAERSRELFKAAVVLADHLLASPAAATLGRKDGLHWHFILGTIVSPGSIGSCA